MRFSTGKCRVIHMGRNNFMHQYMLEAELLERSSAEKDLGALVANSLAVSQQGALWPRRPLGSWDALHRVWPAG